MAIKFKDRLQAGRLLALKLMSFANDPEVLVLALPRGGVPVAFEVARSLNATLDVFPVRKLGVPGQKELAMGAIAIGGIRILNKEIVECLKIPDKIIDLVTKREEKELERRALAYRGSSLLPEVQDRTVILVDDGIATGSTMLAAVEALRQSHPLQIIVATPLASPSACENLKKEVDDFVCISMPEQFEAVGLWYQDFKQITDEEVKELLARAAKSKPAGSYLEQNDKEGRWNEQVRKATLYS